MVEKKWVFLFIEQMTEKVSVQRKILQETIPISLKHITASLT